MKIKVKWVRTMHGYSAWTCRYGNIEAQSTISATKCFKNLLSKLKSSGINTSNIEPTPKIIRRKEQTQSITPT